MFHWKKRGVIFDPRTIRDRPWLNEFAQAPCVLELEDCLRVYFSCRPRPDDAGQYVSYTGFVDISKDDLTSIIQVSKTPILPLGAKGTFDEFGVYPTSVIQEKDRVVAYFGGWTRCESVPFNVAIGRAESLDGGITFKRTGDGPVLSYSPNEPFILSGPKIRKYGGKYYLFYIAGSKWIPTGSMPEPVYRVRMAYSEDGISWTKLDQDLIPVRIETDECQASPDVFYEDGVYHMFFCYRYSLGFRSKEKGYRIGYAYSTDLENWVRDDAKAGIDVSESGWDSEMISYPHIFKLRGSIYMLYLGNGVGRFGFGLAELNSKSFNEVL